jgi:hypothetical protein
MWAAIYIIEVFAILSVLKRYPDDAQKAVSCQAPTMTARQNNFETLALARRCFLFQCTSTNLLCLSTFKFWLFIAVWAGKWQPGQQP